MKKNNILIFTSIFILCFNLCIHSASIEDDQEIKIQAEADNECDDLNCKFCLSCNKLEILGSKLEKIWKKKEIIKNDYEDAIKIIAEMDEQTEILRGYELSPEFKKSMRLTKTTRISMLKQLEENTIKCNHCQKKLNLPIKCLCKDVYFCNYECKNKDLNHQKCIRSI